MPNHVPHLSSSEKLWMAVIALLTSVVLGMLVLVVLNVMNRLMS